MNDHDDDDDDEISEKSISSIYSLPGKETRLDAAQEIDELRGKLARRNALLNDIRKCYHRDVLVVKECLIDAQRQIHGNNHDSSLSLTLQSVPSIDLRETFRLYAPHECEMRIRPCWSCGGNLEIIHRESTRIVEFKHSIQLLWEREKELCEELIEVKGKAQEDRYYLQDIMKRNQDEQAVLLEQISSLKQQVVDRNALDAEVCRLKEDVRNLKEILRSQEPMILDRERLLAEIERKNCEAEQDNKKFNEQVEQTALFQHANEAQALQLLLLGQERDQLTLNLLESSEQCKKAEVECAFLRRELSVREAETNDIKARSEITERTIGELQIKFKQDECRMMSSIAHLESKSSTLEATLSVLDDRLKASSADAEFYRMGLEAALEDAHSRGLIACVPRQRTVAIATVSELILETDRTLSKSGVLFNLLLGCIRSMYESCLKQERLLRDHGSELQKNDLQIKSSEYANDKARMVLNHLNNADESNIIDWVSFLSDETDRRHILGNLQNRLQMGLFSLDKACQKARETHALEMCTRRLDLDQEMKIRWDTERDLAEAISLNRKYETTIIKIQVMKVDIQRRIDSLRVGIYQLRNECLRNNEITVVLNSDCERVRTLANRLIDDFHASKKETDLHKVYLAEKDVDISIRDAAMEKMEALLEKITHKYAEKELLRIKVHADAGVQVAPLVTDATVHADFLPAVMPIVNPTVSENKTAADALIPGRVLNVDCVRKQNGRHPGLGSRTQ